MLLSDPEKAIADTQIEKCGYNKAIILQTFL